MVEVSWVVEAPPFNVARPVKVVAPLAVSEVNEVAPVIEAVPVAVRLANVRFPENSALPWTERD